MGFGLEINGKHLPSARKEGFGVFWSIPVKSRSQEKRLKSAKRVNEQQEFLSSSGLWQQNLFFFWSSLQGLCCSWPGRDSQWPSSQLTHGICGISLSLHRSARCPCHLCRLLQAYGRMESKRALLWIAPNYKLSCWISFFFFFCGFCPGMEQSISTLLC